MDRSDIDAITSTEEIELVWAGLKMRAAIGVVIGRIEANGVEMEGQ